MLEEIVEPLPDTHFEESDYCFQRDLAPAHKAKEVQQWLMEKESNFSVTNEWLSRSLNPVGLLIMELSGDHVWSLTHQSGRFKVKYC